MSKREGYWSGGMNSFSGYLTPALAAGLAAVGIYKGQQEQKRFSGYGAYANVPSRAPNHRVGLPQKKKPMRYRGRRTRLKRKRGRTLTRTKRKKKRRRKSRRPFNKKRYKAIKRIANTLVGAPIKQKDLSATHETVSKNVCKYTFYSLCTNSTMEGLIDTEIKVRAAGGGETAIDFRTAKQNNAVRFRSCCMRVEFRNNDNVPIKMWLWTAKPKRKNTDASPLGELITGLDNVSGGDNALETHPDFWPGHSVELRKSFTLYNSKYVMLNPGEEYVYYVKTPGFTYRPDEFDKHDKTYSWFTRFLFLKFRGVIAHDTTTKSLVGYSAASVDVSVSRSYHYLPYANQSFISRYTGSNTLDTLAAEEISTLFDPGKEAPEA